MRCGIPSGRPLGFLVTAGSSPKKADGGAKGIFHMCLMGALSSDISSERKISPVMSHKTSYRDVGVQGPEIPQPVLRDGLELGKVARSEVQDTSGEGQTRQVEVAFPYALPNFSSGHPRDGDLWGKKAEGVHPNEPNRRGRPSGKSRPGRLDGAQGEGWSPVRPFREVGARRHFEVGHKDAEPVLWGVTASDVVQRKQGVPFRDGSRSLRDPEVSSGAIPGGRLAVKGEAFAEEVSLPSEWQSSSKQGDEERLRSEVPLHREVIVRPERKYSPEAFSPSREGDWEVQADEGPLEEAYIEVGHVESMQEGGVGIERRDQNEGLRTGDSRASGRVQLGRMAGGKIYQRLGESELVPMSSGREGRKDGGGKGDVSSDRGAFIGRSDLEGIALRDGLRRGDVVRPEVVSEGETQVGISPGDGPSGGSSPLEEDAVSKGLFWMNDKTTWPAAEPQPVKIVGPKTGFDFPSGGPGRGSIRPVGSQPKDRPGIAPDHVRRRARQVRGARALSAQRDVRDEAPGRAISERDIGPRATPKEPYPHPVTFRSERIVGRSAQGGPSPANSYNSAEVPLRPAVRPSTPYKRGAERAYERAFGIEGGGITAAPEGRASGTQDLPAGDVRSLAAKIEEISARAARTDLPSGRIRVIFRTSVEGAGQVHVEVSREPTGAVAVFVRVQNQGLRDELLKASPQIRQALAEGGVQLARLEVEAEDHPVGWEGPIGDEGPSRRGYYHRFKRKSRGDRGWTG